MVLCSAMAFFYQYPMNLREQIIQWLDDGYYLQGVALYRQVGGIYPISTFEGYEEANYVPEAVEQKLRYALENYLTDNPVFEQEVVYHPPKKKTIHFQEVEPPPPTPTPTEPDVIHRLRQQAKNLHKRQDDLKSRLNLMVEEATKFSEQERYDIANELLAEVTPQLDSIYDRIREWQKTGEVPAVAKNDIVRDTVEKMQTIKYREQRISKIKSLLKKTPSQERKADLEKELLEKQVEVKKLKEELGL